VVILSINPRRSVPTHLLAASPNVFQEVSRTQPLARVLTSQVKC
jgi:hypothetical protein